MNKKEQEYLERFALADSRFIDNKEWLEIDQRKKNGERLSDILDEMKVLK